MTHPLSTGGTQDPLLPRLLNEIRNATEIDMAVSFVMLSGLDLVFDPLVDALTLRGPRLRILTSDYLGVTEPRALRKLMLLCERGASVRVFQARESSFHVKAYLFVRTRDGRVLDGSAFIGSSNLSRLALTDGIEWNWRVDGDELSARLLRIREAFAALFRRSETCALDWEWIEAYEARRGPPRIPPASETASPRRGEGIEDAEALFRLAGLSQATEPEEGEVPEPYPVQEEALEALGDSRATGQRRGLVVMATGLGKTWLAAFDVVRTGARKVLFVAHREEILLQAQETFQRILPGARVGRYDGTTRDRDVDLLFASVQTLGRSEHLESFPASHFDYVVVDEFHHAAAPTYRRLLGHFRPGFLLGLTATPDRTDQSDILSLCDDNLVFSCPLFEGIQRGYLLPFRYFGILDEEVEYQEIPWRRGRFDPDQLTHKLATLARARHVLREWQKRAGERTLAFCVSRSHADFMAGRFQREGIRAVSVHGAPVPAADRVPVRMDRTEALEQLKDGSVQVIFSVDLFNEGVDVPAIDTVLMLRPSESRILFLQQLGRGLRHHEGLEALTVLDFIGNHRAFLNKPQALFGVGTSHRDLADLGRQLGDGTVELPPGCFVNYDLRFIDFLQSLDPDSGLESEYRLLRDGLGRRPTAAEFFRAGGSFTRVRREYGGWFSLLGAEDDLESEEIRSVERYGDFLKEVESTRMVKSFKMVLLEALLENDGLGRPPTLEDLARWSLEQFQRRRYLVPDLADDVRNVDKVPAAVWQRYWTKNPVTAWTGGFSEKEAIQWFEVRAGRFVPSFAIEEEDRKTLTSLVQELVEYRMASYAHRASSEVTLPDGRRSSRAEGEDGEPGLASEPINVPYFPDLPVACGHFRAGGAVHDELRSLGPEYGELEPGRHFLAHAVGDSMDGGDEPIRDRDLLLFERTDVTDPGRWVGETVVMERPHGAGGGAEYLLRAVEAGGDGVVLRAGNSTYEPIEAGPDERAVARLRAVVDPLDLRVGEEFIRAEIPPLFDQEFTGAVWNSGHIVLREPLRHVLLVTLNKQGRVKEFRYHDRFLEDGRFQWQSQNRTGPDTGRGEELIQHESRGIPVYLFVREHRLRGPTAAPFRFYGRVRYQEHSGSKPMTVIWGVARQAFGEGGE